MAYGPNAGTSATVEGGAPGSQQAGGISGLFGGMTKKAVGPNVGAYDQERNAAQGSADAYHNLSTNYTQTGPTISNQFQGQSRAGIGGNVADQRNLANTLLNNNGEASKAQFQQGLDSGVAAQMALANSTNGGSVARAGALRNAQQTGATMQAGGAATAAELGAREREASLAQAGNVYGQVGSELQSQYGLEQGSAIHQGMLDSANNAQTIQARLGYGGLGNQSQAQSEQALNDYTTQNLNSQELSANMKHADAKDTNDAIGTIAGVAGSALSFLARGGPLHAGRPTVVGEQGPEMVVPKSFAQYAGPVTGPAKAREASLAEALAGIEHLKARVAELVKGHVG